MLLAQTAKTQYFSVITLLFLSYFPLAQQNSPKIHEGWWAYKEVVQGSFVPGKIHLFLIFRKEFE